MRDVWGIHDFIPDYSQARSVQDLSARMEAGTMPGGPSGCGYYRVTQPLDALAVRGWDTAYAFGEPPGDPAEVPIAKIIVAQRMDKQAALPYWRRWRRNQRLVYEIDDNVFEIDITNWMAYSTYGKAEVRDAVEHACEVADLVTVTTEPLAEILRPLNPNVAVIPNAVDARVLDIDRPRRDKVVVGWGGGASHANDIMMISATLRHVLQRHARQAELHIIGTDYRETVGRPGRFTSWVPVNSSLDYYRAIDFDIALAPLTGTLFDQSKSAIKAVEASALGIPVLASDVEPYREFIKDGVNGYLCSSPRDWGKRLEELINDADARAEMGANGREIVRQAHTMSTVADQWAAAYEGLL